MEMNEIIRGGIIAYSKWLLCTTASGIVLHKVMCWLRDNLKDGWLNDFLFEEVEIEDE